MGDCGNKSGLAEFLAVSLPRAAVLAAALYKLPAPARPLNFNRRTKA